jgi:hypothetical protein
MIRRFCEVLRQTGNSDESVWITWLDDFPVPINRWADARLARLEEQSSTIRSVDDERLQKAVGAMSATTPTRTSVRRPIHNRLRLKEEISLFLWAGAVGMGLAPAKSLYDPASAPFDALRRAAGLGADWKPPDQELLVESFSIRRMRDVLREASVAEMEQARRDWKAIGALAAASKAIDWHVVRKALNVQRTSSAQPPAPVDYLLAVWRDFDVRAQLLTYLIFIRRSPDHSHRLSELLAVADSTLQHYPRRASDKSKAQVVVPTPET